MAVTYSNTVKNNRMTQVLNAIDGGAGNGVLKIGTTGMAATLVSITLDKPSGTVASQALTFSGLPNSGTATGAGTAAAAQITDSTGTVVVDGLTVGTSGTDVIIDNTSIAIGQTVNLNAVSSISHG